MNPNTTALILLSLWLTQCAPSSNDTQASARAQIEEILRTQEEAYDLNNEEGRRQLLSTCKDSLLFIGGDSGGLAMTAEYYVHDLADGYVARPHDRVFAIYGNTAIVTSLQETFKVFNDDTIHFHSRYTKVFVRDGDSWKMALVTYAPLPVNYAKATRYSTAAFKDYAGVYQGATTPTDTISMANGKLYIGSAESGSELIPLNDSTFIGEGYAGKTVFARNSKGQVTHSYFEYPDGQRIHAKKLQ